MAGEPENIAFLTQDIHMLPYFHGNRSPRANPTLTGILTGLKLSRTPEDMALHYLATIQAIALGTRHIIETMNHSGYSIDTIMASGGGTRTRSSCRSTPTPPAAPCCCRRRAKRCCWAAQ